MRKDQCSEIAYLWFQDLALNLLKEFTIWRQCSKQQQESASYVPHLIETLSHTMQDQCFYMPKQLLCHSILVQHEAQSHLLTVFLQGVMVLPLGACFLHLTRALKAYLNTKTPNEKLVWLLKVSLILMKKEVSWSFNDI